MASPAPCEQAQAAQTGQKRKREDEEVDVKIDIIDDDADDEGDTRVDTNALIPDDYQLVDEEEEDQDPSDDNDANVGEDNADHPTHNESEEKLPECAIYDDAIEDIQEVLGSILSRLQDTLSDHESKSKALKSHMEQVKKVIELPPTKKIRIAILGGAGAGKSWLLNAVTGKPDLAKSVRAVRTNLTELR